VGTGFPYFWNSMGWKFRLPLLRFRVYEVTADIHFLSTHLLGVT